MFKETDHNNDGVVSKRELFQLILRLIMEGANLGVTYDEMTPEE